MLHLRHFKTRPGVSVNAALAFLLVLALPLPHAFGKSKQTTQTAASLLRFSADTYIIGEGSGHIDVTVTRSGDASHSATVSYNTFDDPGAGRASQTSDYEIALGTLTFAPGETSKTFRLLLIDDKSVEGAEVIGLALSNPTGAGVELGHPATAELTVNDDDTSPPSSNPVDDSAFFVRQHYLDFLNREPDPEGFNFWVNQITSCGTDLQCREVKRINVSAAFFLSIEFKRTSLFLLKAHKLAFGASPSYKPFMRDLQALQRNYVFGQPGAAAQLEANKRAYLDEFVTRPEFVAKYGAMSNRDFVSELLKIEPLSFARNGYSLGRLDGSQVVPPNNTPAAGFLILERSPSSRFFTDPVTAWISLSLSDLTSPQTAAHIHGPAEPGTNGPVLFTLPLGDFNSFQIPLTLEHQSLLFNGRLYVDVHTENNPDGEIRVQVLHGRTADVLTDALDKGVLTRAQVLRILAESDLLKVLFDRGFDFSPDFVLMQYFGYLRRDPDQAGFDFWLSKINLLRGAIGAEMVKAFIHSTEYRQRFGL